MSDLTKHTLTINISDRIEWIDKRCGLTEIQKDYITAQMKEAVSEAVQQANGVTTGEKQCNLPVVSESKYYMLQFVANDGLLYEEIREGEIDIDFLKSIYDSGIGEFISAKRIYFR